MEGRRREPFQMIFGGDKAFEKGSYSSLLIVKDVPAIKDSSEIVFEVNYCNRTHQPKRDLIQFNDNSPFPIICSSMSFVKS